MENLFATPSATSREGTHELIVDHNEHLVDVVLRVSASVENFVARSWHEGEPPKPQILLQLDLAKREARLFPQITYRRDDLYGPKYEAIREIIFDLPADFEPPGDGEEAQAIINEIMPLGFMKQAEYGLGFVMLMRPVVNAIEQIKGISRIAIRQDEATRIELDTFYFNAGDYRLLADGMHRISRRFQEESRKDREILAFNSTLHRTQPKQFKEKSRPYQPGTIFKLLGGASANEITLMGKDRRSVLSVVARNAKNIAKRDLKELIQLQKDVDLVSLDELIDVFERKLNGNANERDWQELLELNPFILSMLFGQPIVVLQPSASVGGMTIAGSGTKIADFVATNALTHNAALVELKRPATSLCGKRYRSGVFTPSPDLMGAVVQILDQRLKLVTNVAALRYQSSLEDFDVYAVECVIVAGRTPPDAELSSFELMRGQLKDVRIVTFDELLQRLKMLRELLAGERYISPPDAEDFDSDEAGSELDKGEREPWESEWDEEDGASPS